MKDVEQQLSGHLGRTADEAIPTPDLDAITSSVDVARGISSEQRNGGRSQRWLPAAAAVLVLGAIGGLAVVANRDPAAPAVGGPPTAIPAESPIPADAVGNFVPGNGFFIPGDEGGFQPEVLNLVFADSGFDGTSEARLVGAPDSGVGAVSVSVWRMVSIVTTVMPPWATEQQLAFDTGQVVVSSDASGLHHLVEDSRADGTEVRIEATDTDIDHFAAVLANLVYQDPAAWEATVDTANGVEEGPGTAVVGTMPVAKTTVPSAVSVRTESPDVDTTLPAGDDETDATQPSPTRLPDSTDVAISDTIFPPQRVVAEPVDVTNAEMEAIVNDNDGRQTVALERGSDGTILWWMTVWAGTTPSGSEVYCTALYSAGESCVPDRNVELTNPVQIGGFTEAPAAVTLITDDTVISLRASLDEDEPIDIELVDIGVASGKQVAGLYIGGQKSTVRLYATLNDGSTFSFGIAAPQHTPAPAVQTGSTLDADAPRELFQD